MPFGIDPDAAPEDTAASTSEAPVLNQDEARELSGATDTPETTVEETDEQRNDRALAERRERSEKQARGVQRRIDELTADKHSERQAREALQRELEILRGQNRTAQPQRGQPDPNAEPQKADFDDWEKYNRALARYEARQIVLAENHAINERQRHHAHQVEADARAREFSARQGEFAKQRPDYHEKMSAAADVMIPETLGDAIMAMPNGPAIALFMAENPQVASAVANQPEMMQGVVLGNISAHLSSSQVSNAPRPGKPVGGSGSGSDAPPTDTAAYNRWAAKRGL